jgi:hypothetical protein
MNKDTRELLRKLRKQGAVVVQRNNGNVEIRGPRGFYLLHTTLAAGQPMHMTRRLIRERTGLEP